VDVDCIVAILTLRNINGAYGVSFRSKLRELFPVASFSGGICLSDGGLDLMNKLLNIDPKQVNMENNAPMIADNEVMSNNYATSYNDSTAADIGGGCTEASMVNYRATKTDTPQQHAHV
jgi:hypothetical protein